MDAGQITQGLRADSFQQNANGNGISVAQMTGNGISFADIMSVIIANGQEMQNIGNMQLVENLSDNQIMENPSDMQNLLGFNDLQGFQEFLNAINIKGIKDELNVSDLQKFYKILNTLDLHGSSDLKKAFFEISSLFELKNDDYNIEKNDSFITADALDSNKSVSNFIGTALKVETDKTDAQNIGKAYSDDYDFDTTNADSQNIDSVNADSHNVDSADDDGQNVDSSNADRSVENITNVPKKPDVSNSYANDSQNWFNKTEIQHKDVWNIQNTISSNLNSDDFDSENAYEIIDNPESEKNYLLSENFNAFDKYLVNKTDKMEVLNNNLTENFTDNFKTESDPTSVSEVHNVSNKHEIYSIKNVSERQNNVKIKGTSNNKFERFKSQSSNERSDKIQNLLGMQNIPDMQNTQGIQNVQNAKDVAYNAYNVMNLRDINAVSDILGFDKEDKSSIQKSANIQNANSENPISQKLIEIFSVASPEILKNLENVSADENVNNGSKFVMDLISELSNEKNKSDIFDFSESVVKVDPLQLAGLLDFISTGTTIPQAGDVSDSQLFKNIDKTEVVENSSGKLIFDPEEMIRTGEMEIVSYVPAKKSSDAHLKQDKNPLENGEKTIDFARTMKSVKENVKPSFVDDTEEPKDNIAMTVEDMSSSAEKIDISFDRAYAELEMNKAKYGSADEQLFKGIAESLKKGRSEFTVKLRPEGLGEILVKLVSNEAGKTILSMVASSEKTAQLLNRDLASLQSSLNQHNVEIENNSVKTVETVMAAQSSFDQYDERRQDEANQQNQFRKLRSKLGNISVGNVSFENEPKPVSNVNIDSALNIKI